VPTNILFIVYFSLTFFILLLLLLLIIIIIIIIIIINYSSGADDITELVLKLLQMNWQQLYYHLKLSVHI